MYVSYLHINLYHYLKHVKYYYIIINVITMYKFKLPQQKEVLVVPIVKPYHVEYHQ